MIIKMIQELGNRLEAQKEKLQKVFNKELPKLKYTITEMKNTLEGIDSIINEAEGWNSELEDRGVEITAAEQNKDKRM